MNRNIIFSILLASGSALAGSSPTARYNEAVQVRAGQRVVQVASVPSHMQPIMGSLRKPDGSPMRNKFVAIETPGGLMDCATLWYHPSSCIPSTFGVEKQHRSWVVLMGGKWFVCASHLAPKECEPIVTDGRLRVAPDSYE